MEGVTQEAISLTCLEKHHTIYILCLTEHPKVIPVLAGRVVIICRVCQSKLGDSSSLPSPTTAHAGPVSLPRLALPPIKLSLGSGSRLPKKCGHAGPLMLNFMAQPEQTGALGLGHRPCFVRWRSH